MLLALRSLLGGRFVEHILECEINDGYPNASYR